MAYRVLSHTADTGVEATADSFPQLLEQLLEGMFGLMADMTGAPVERWVEAEVEAEVTGELVVDALSEALYLSEVEDLALCEFHAAGDQHLIHLRMGGVPPDAVETAGPPIKAVTYHGLALEHGGGRWYGRVFFDV